MAHTIVLISGGYYPDFSATGNCIRQIANCFVQKGNEVYMISTSPDGQETNVDFEGQHIYRAASKRSKDIAMIKATKKRPLPVKIKFTAIKSYWAIVKLLAKSGMDEGLVDAYVNKLEELMRAGVKIDCIVPCCMPAEGIKAGYIFASKYHIPLFPLLYDRYSDNRDYFRFTWAWKMKKKSAEKFENELFDYAKKVFYIDNWGPYFEKYKRENAVRVEHPLVVKKAHVTPVALKDPTKINAIYQGEVNHQMRPPQAMLTAFSKIAESDKDVSLHVFASGNGTEDVKKAATDHPDCIRFYGKVGKELADQYYASANIQIILANRDREIVSSKIFESVASGYPIVYFYFSEDELSYGLLKKYPLVLFVRQDKVNEETENIRKWMYENCDKRVDFDLVAKAYDDATPDLVVDTAIDILNESEG